MGEFKWRFPGNNYTTDNGLDTADMETFKKDAISSLAREVCQNSIDARRKDAVGPVRIEFKSFEICKDAIPGRDAIEQQIQDCLGTWTSHKKINGQLTEMLAQIKKESITCLRISDFNTTGLVGVSGDEKSPWRYLIHGSGISDKGETSGGSKGIGKFATFVTSHFNTVFYSTVTEKGESGFEGICKLCSAKMPDTTEKTQGIGYFGSSDKNEPIPQTFSLEPTFNRKSNDYGSDIFIVGFKNPKEWQKDIISKILDSFMSAIVFGTLEVVVNDIVINTEKLVDIVYNDSYINSKIRKSIISQFLLLTDKDHRCEDVITIDDYGTAKLYLMEFDKEHEDLATNDCVMIRYPYMKIKDIKKISTLPCSAMCIIENNDLNKILRNVENPQHTDWEFKRIEDDSERAEVRGIYNELLDQIRKIITEHLSSSDNSKTDIEGAGDYIPGVDPEVGTKPTEKKRKIVDKPSVQKKIKIKELNINASVPDDDGNGVTLDIGTDGGDEDIVTPEGSNESSGGSARPGEHEGKGTPGNDGHILMKPADLRGMAYRFFCINKKERRYVISFTSDFDETEAFLELYALDDSGQRYEVKIESCLVNGIETAVEKSKLVKLELEHGKKYKVEMVTNQKDLFSGEVKVYAYR
ncbi:MAG: hypothetical protein SPF87_03065 [Bacilli bacterium]|nr:hypothetical protein [Bacilli bacterium]